MSQGQTSLSPESTEQKPTPWKAIFGAKDKFLNDLECLSEMLMLVAPALKEKDEERDQRIKEITSGFKREEKNQRLKSVEDISELISHVKKIQRADRMFRQGLVTSIVSRFDEFLIGVLKVAYQQNAGWLKNPDKKVTYKELLEIASIEDFKSDLIRREVELLMRDSHFNQIEFLDGGLKLGVIGKFSGWKDFLEITERRNLFVHTGGRISPQYIENSTRHGFSLPPKAEEGVHLSASDTYIFKAIDVFYETAVRVAQAVARRLFPDCFDAADTLLTNCIVELLNQERWLLAERMSQYALGIPEALRTNGEAQYYLRINLSIALKFSGKDYAAELGAVNWAPFHPKYHLAVAVLKDEFDAAEKLMRSEAVLQQVGESEFKRWPLFKAFRTSPQFERAFRDIFKKDIAIELIHDAQQEMEAQLESMPTQQEIETSAALEAAPLEQA